EALDPFCRAVRRDVIDQVGRFEVTDDFCERARAAGFHLAIADDSYVVRHGAAPGDASPVPDGDPLRDLRERVRPAMQAADAMPIAFKAARPEALTLGFVMPNMAHGGSGGLHSVYQEASGLRALGVDTVILANGSYMKYARLAYEDADELFVEYETDEALE